MNVSETLLQITVNQLEYKQQPIIRFKPIVVLIALRNFRRKFTIIIALVAPASCSHFVNNLVLILRMIWLTQCRYFKMLPDTLADFIATW